MLETVAFSKCCTIDLMRIDTKSGCSIIHVSGSKQLNVRGAGKDEGTEVITYQLAQTGQSQFLLKMP